jgi:hypothetical protein
MDNMEREKTFGVAQNCASLKDVLDMIASSRGKPTIRRVVAAYGMLLQASQSVRTTTYIEDSRYVVDQLSRAKTEIDIAAWHMPDVTEATGLILAGAQAFLDQETIGSTEWPTPNEVSEIVAKIAAEFAART